MGLIDTWALWDDSWHERQITFLSIFLLVTSVHGFGIYDAKHENENSFVVSKLLIMFKSFCRWLGWIISGSNAIKLIGHL